MPLAVGDLETLETYLNGVLNRSEHHAQTVGAIALALIGAVLWRKDDEPIQVRTYAGGTANILWFYVSGVRYALAYNHRNGRIELRQRTQNGRTLARFNNRTPVTRVQRVFREL